jgi:hypothetical protein
VFGTNAEPALVAGARSPESRWLLLPTVPPKGGQATMVVQNPTRVPAEVEIRLFGTSGPLFPANRTLTVPAGRAVTVELAQLAGTAPVATLVTATSGTVVVGGASYGSGGAGYAVTLAVPVIRE